MDATNKTYIAITAFVTTVCLLGLAFEGCPSKPDYRCYMVTQLKTERNYPINFYTYIVAPNDTPGAYVLQAKKGISVYHLNKWEDVQDDGANYIVIESYKAFMFDVGMEGEPPDGYCPVNIYKLPSKPVNE